MLRLTEGLNGSEERRKLVGDEGRAAETAALAEKFNAGVLQASDHRGSTHGDPAKMTEGLRGCKDHRRRGITEAELLTRDDGRGRNPVMPGSRA
jgi:hypothetical protein